ncbi:hypothetical protein [Microcoleus sp. B5-D4]|uniref:hypothetical protein n=1 Tax=Microcoleus sp. B5-D4 TaxID=2818681 RepID=UPI002FD56684
MPCRYRAIGVSAMSRSKIPSYVEFIIMTIQPNLQACDDRPPNTTNTSRLATVKRVRFNSPKSSILKNRQDACSTKSQFSSCGVGF